MCMTLQMLEKYEHKQERTSDLSFFVRVLVLTMSHPLSKRGGSCASFLVALMPASFQRR